MKLINKAYLFLIASCIAYVGCKKQLDLNPTDTVTDETIFLTITDIQSGVNGAHARMGAYNNDLYVNALLSDEAKLGSGNSGQGAQTFRYQFNSDGTSGGDVIGGFSSYYALINHCNLVLSKISGVTGEQTLKNEYRGQLLALRALGHFYLLRSYAGNYNPNALGIPYVDYNDIFRKPARETMSQVISKINKDLDEAMDLLPATFTFTDIYINRTNLAGLRSRIALYTGDYQNAIDYATTAITQSNRPLANSLTQLNEMWSRNDNRTRESIYTVRYENSAAVGGLWGTSTGDIYIAPSDKLIDALNEIPTDLRRTAYLNSTGEKYVFKYRGSTRGGSANLDNRVVDLKVLRTADLYLIRAEAYARLNTPNLNAGMLDLQTLRQARGISGAVTGLDQTGLLDAIINERFKEFCFEGSRFWDLRRFNLPVNRNPSDANANWRTLPANSFRFILPIPFDEMLVNPNMKQNPGYN